MENMRQAYGRTLSRVMGQVYCRPWLILPEMHSQIREIVHAHISGAAHTIGIMEDFEEEKPADMIELRDGIAVVNVSGVLGKRVSLMEKSSGVTDVDDMMEAMRDVMSMNSVAGVILKMDSPGGEATGIPEAAAEIREMRMAEGKPVVGYTDTMAVSGGYWLLSQTNPVLASASARVGGIGAYVALLDRKAMYDNNGVKREILTSGKYKGAGYDGTSLTDEQRKQLQGDVDYLAGVFKEAVQAGRGRTIKDDVMQGQTFFGSQAEHNGLIDSVGNMQTVVRFAQRGRG